MDGQIIAREPDRHFAMKFTDKMMDVTVDFVAASDGVGTTLTHSDRHRHQGDRQGLHAADQARPAEADDGRDDQAQGDGRVRLSLERLTCGDSRPLYAAYRQP